VLNTSFATADLSFNNDRSEGKLSFADSHRMVNPDLAGGALLDLGIYSLTWLFQILYHLQPEGEKEAPQVFSSVHKYQTGADESTSILLHFPKYKYTGIGTTSLRANTGPTAIKIQGSAGEIQVAHPAFKPLQFKVFRQGAPEGEVEVVDCPIPKDAERNWGHGMFWEADECARCLRDGQLESATLPLEESLVMMEVMETALAQGNIVYPEVITTDVYDPNSPLNTGKK
jgi:predicted dehydrogenase